MYVLSESLGDVEKIFPQIIELCIKIDHSSRLGKEFIQTTSPKPPPHPFAKLLVSP